MQGLSAYGTDDSPPNPEAGPSRFKGEPVSASAMSSTRTSPHRRSASPRRERNGDSSEAPSKRARRESPKASASSSAAPSPPSKAASRGRTATPDPFAGLSDEQVFRLVTRPDDVPGIPDWGIPAAADTALASDKLKAKVSQFLKLKQKGQHINTSLLSSSSFANPHIYSKLVEFVDLEERATAFPGGGWLTRRNIEAERETYSAEALTAQQRAMEEAVRRSQETSGSRREIAFAPARTSEVRYSDRDRRGGSSGRREEERRRDPVSRPKSTWMGGRRDRR